MKGRLFFEACKTHSWPKAAVRFCRLAKRTLLYLVKGLGFAMRGECIKRAFVSTSGNVRKQLSAPRMFCSAK